LSVGDVFRLSSLLKETEPWKLTRQRGLHDSDYERPWRLADLLEISSASFCHDKRDKVYGILGLCGNSFRRTIAIDYTCSLFEVYENTLKCVDRLGVWDDIGKDSNCANIVHFSYVIQKALLGPHFESIDYHSMTKGRLRILDMSKGCGHEYMALSGISLGHVHLIIPVPPELCDQNSTRVQEINIEQPHTEIEDAFLWKSREWGMLWEAWAASRHPYLGTDHHKECIMKSKQLTLKKILQEAWELSSGILDDLQYTKANDGVEDVDFADQSRGLSGRYKGNIVIFVTETGYVGLARKEIKVGDILWRTRIRKASQAIVRQVHRDTEFVSRSAMFHWSVQPRHKMDEDVEIKLRVDVPSLQILTCPIRRST
jgi:hypothetical protein